MKIVRNHIIIGYVMQNEVTYADSGVSIDNANKAVARIKDFAKATFNSRTLTEIGSFGGMFDARFPEMQQPILVSSADGVGTKLKIAFMANRHDSVGQCLVNHCVNDILVQGARPLFFMDYFSTGVLDPEVTANVVEGMAKACKENSCVLLGGETAEMPSMYAQGEYDLAGFIVGVVDKKDVIDGTKIANGDVLLGIPSSGLHTNGYSLARKILIEIGGYDVDTLVPEIGATVAESLLAVHKSYLHSVGNIIDSGKIKGLVHITGGGFYENIPRILPENVGVKINRGSWNELPVFGKMQAIGSVSDFEMFRTFNMGIGMIVVCSKENCDYIVEQISQTGENAYVIGSVVEGKRSVEVV